MITKKTYLSHIHIYLVLAYLFLPWRVSISFGQDSTKNEPVFNTFSCGTFLENQTYMTNYPKSIEFVINHRFGQISDGAEEAWGLYSPSNIRLGINYAIDKNLQIGLGTTKYDKQQDANIKYLIMQQSTNNKIPVSLSYFGSVSYDARNKKNFDYNNYKLAHRFSYFHEFMIARKFGDLFSLQLAPIYTHFNVVESDSLNNPIRKNDNLSLSILGKFTLTPTLNLFFEFDKNFTKLIKETELYKNPQPVIAFGIEKATAAHSFQLFISTGEAIIYQKNLVYNQNKAYNQDCKNSFKSDIVIGLNITRLFY